MSANGKIDDQLKRLSVKEEETTSAETSKAGATLSADKRASSEKNSKPKKQLANGAKGSGSGRGGGGGKRENESPQVQVSKALAYILRHGTTKEGLKVRADGYVALDDVLARPRVAKIQTATGHAPTLEDIREIVEGRGNEKKRFEMHHDEQSGVWLIRAVQGHSIAQVTDLDHVRLSLDNLNVLAADPSAAPVAKMGSTEASLPDGIEILHGTTKEAWEKILESGGLSRMKRNHIHLAKVRPRDNKPNASSPSSTVISGMRASSAVIVHVDMIKAIQQGIVFQLASNGAVLTAGEAKTGMLPLRYISKAEDAKTGDIIWSQSDVEA